MTTTDTQVQQLVINVGTTAQIEAAIAGGQITENMLSVTTDGDTYIQGVKVNGTELTPDANNKVDVIVPTDTSDLTNGAGYITSSALNDYVTLNTVQKMTAAKSIVGTDSAVPGTNQANIFAALSTQTSTQPDNWKGRMMVGAKNATFLMGVYNNMAGIGAHAWTDSAAGSGAAWANFYLNPDGAQTVYIGGYAWRQNAGWFRVQNTGGNTGGKTQVNIGSQSSSNWKDVAYKGENISDFSFTSISGYNSSSNQMLTHDTNGNLKWVDI